MSEFTIFKAEFDSIDRSAWYSILPLFDDATIDQTGFYGIRWQHDNLSYFVLKRGAEIVAAAQVSLFLAPVIGTGIASVRLGPLWRRRGSEPDLEVFRQAVRALRAEYAERRGLVLRIFPNAYRNDETGLADVLEAEGLRAPHPEAGEERYLVDLAPSTDDLLKGVHQNWRRFLRRSQKYELEVAFESGPEAVDLFLGLYGQMRDRKSRYSTFYGSLYRVADFRDAYQTLPEELRPKILICRRQGEPVAGSVISAIGNTAIYIYGASTALGRECLAGYFLHWYVVCWLKSRGIRWYDLGVGNPAALRQFKRHLVGRNGVVAPYLGEFELAGSFSSNLTVQGILRLKSLAAKTKVRSMEIKTAVRRFRQEAAE